ncbi:uncharacterized protein LOC141631938 [Silene latifolia]|uniref:uncharacterized protein LOC141631938 n=1 Tax=Silene latifolia TaxID=37657 RepID=UPI003D772CD0
MKIKVTSDLEIVPVNEDVVACGGAKRTLFHKFIPQATASGLDKLRITKEERTLVNRVAKYNIHGGWSYFKTTRLKKKDCECLVDKICNRIHSYGARKFSYAGRLTLVKHVLNTLHSYWASVFVLPKGVILRIEAICRNFLWDGSAEYRRTPLVAWDTICRPKQEGGLGLKNQELWNIAMGRDLQEYAATSNSSWVWRRICRVKQVLAAGYTHGIWQVQPSGYTPCGCYELLRGTRPKVEWSNIVWDNWNLHKHMFMGWLIAHNSLHTNSRLTSFGMDVDGLCILCGLANETQQHLFFLCAYSRRVLQALTECTGLKLPESHILHWCVHNPGLKTQRGVKNALVMSTLYKVWQQRNKCRLEQVLMRPMCVA